MLAIVFLLSSCTNTTILENRTAYAWNEFDMKTIEFAKKRCPEIYPDSPCLKLFIKLDKQDYYASCG